MSALWARKKLPQVVARVQYFVLDLAYLGISHAFVLYAHVLGCAEKLVNNNQDDT